MYEGKIFRYGEYGISRVLKVFKKSGVLVYECVSYTNGKKFFLDDNDF